MKFTLVLGLAASAMAINYGTPTKRDGASVSSAIAQISASVAALDTAVNGFSGAGDVAGLQTASDNVITAINAGTQTADASAPISDLEAIGLSTPIQDLSALVNTTVQDAINKKPTFDAAGVSPTVLQALQQQLTASQALETAIVSKLSTNLQPTGQNLAQPIIDALNNGIAAFSAPGTSTTPSSGPTTTGAPPTTTGGGAPPTTTGGVAPPPTTTGGVAPPPTTTGGVAPPPTTSAPGGGHGSQSWGGWGYGGHSQSWGHQSNNGWDQWGHHTTLSTSYKKHWGGWDN